VFSKTVSPEKVLQIIFSREGNHSFGVQFRFALYGLYVWFVLYCLPWLVEVRPST